MSHIPRYLVLVAILLVALGAYGHTFGSFQVGVYVDDAEYVVLARSLAQGHGLRLTSFPDAPSTTRYPPGYPLVLAPLARAFPAELAPLQAVSLAATLVSLALAYGLYRAAGCDDGLATGAVLLLALNPIVVAHSGMVMSEPVNLVFTLGALLALRLADGRHAGFLALSGVLSGLAVLTRLSSAPLLVAIGVHILASRRYRRFAAWGLCAMGVLLPYVAYSLGAWSAPVSPVYFRQLRWVGESGNLGVTDLGSLFGRLRTTGGYYFMEAVPSTLLPVVAGPRLMGALRSSGLGWAWALGCSALAAVLVLGWRQATPDRPRGPEGTFLVLYLAMILAWPWHLARLLYPVLPLLYLYLCAGAEWIVRGVGQTAPVRARWAWPRRPGASLLLVVLPLLLLEGWQFGRMSVALPEQHAPDLRPGAEWIAEHTPESAVVMSNHPISRHLYSRRLMVDTPCSAPEVARALLAHDTAADYVLIAPRLVWSNELEDDECSVGVVEPLLRAHPERFVLVHEDADNRVRVYRARDGEGELSHLSDSPSLSMQ